MSEQKPLAWMDEAFKHLGIKEIKGPKTHPEIAKMLVEVKAGWKSDDTVPWCLGPYTEVLTNKGFVRFDELREKKPTCIVQLNIDTNTLEYIADYNIIEKDYNGEVWHHQELGFICDPNHRWYGKWEGEELPSLQPIHLIKEKLVHIPMLSLHDKQWIIVNDKITLAHDDFIIEHYNGKLYCLQVPSEVFIIRTENGTVIPTGNCGIFAGAVLKRTGRAYPVKAPGWALSYRNNGVILEKPAYGAVFTKKRNGGGHVGFVAGITETGMIVGLGGNQSDSVNLALFRPGELTYTWPALANGTKTVPNKERYELPLYDSKTLTLSVKED